MGTLDIVMSIKYYASSVYSICQQFAHRVRHVDLSSDYLQDCALHYDTALSIHDVLLVKLPALCHFLGQDQISETGHCRQRVEP